jgi:hypothetical protein
MNRSKILTQARASHNLNDTGTVWTDATLQKIIDQVLYDCAEREPLLKSACLPVTQYTMDVSLTGITTGLVRVLKVEYPVGNLPYEPVFRDFTLADNIIKLNLDTIPTITSGTLTGTVTFTHASRTVTGAGSAFLTELYSNYDNKNGYLIGSSTGTKYYQIAHIGSNTSLTLAEPFEESTVTDTVSTTKYRNHKSCARVTYGREYTLTRGLYEFYGSGLDDATVNDDYSGTTDLEYRVKITTAGSPDKFKFSTDGGTTWGSETSCATTATVLSNAVSILWAANTGHTLNDYWSWICKPSDVPSYMDNTIICGVTAYAAKQLCAALTDVETALDQVDTDMASARTYINNINIGGPIADGYTKLGEVGVAAATGRMSKLDRYCRWADGKMFEYQLGLKKLGRVSDRNSSIYPRGL